jgi:hypothetical protein
VTRYRQTPESPLRTRSVQSDRSVHLSACRNISVLAPCGLGEARNVVRLGAAQPGSSPVSLRRMTRSEIQRNPPESSEGACPIATNRPRTTRIGTPAGSPPSPENSPDQPRPGGSRRGRAGLKRSAMVRGFAAPASARSTTSRQDDVRNGSSPKYVPPGTCGRKIKRVTRVRFRKERATRQTPCSTTRRRVATGMGSARVPQFSCQLRFAV